MARIASGRQAAARAAKTARFLVYAAAPALLAPLFFVKRVFARNG